MRYLTLFLLFVSSLWADLSVATLNTYFLFSPENTERTTLKREALTPDQYHQKVRNLATLLVSAKPDVVALQEIGSELEGEDMAQALTSLWPEGGKWEVCFSQGKDTYTGQDVVTLVRSSAVQVRRYGRSRDLDNLSKHLVAYVSKDNKTYAVLNVHLVRPIGEQAAKNAEQIRAISQWGAAQSGGIVVLGDFNNDTRNLLPYREAADLTNWQATHLAGRVFDRIYSLPAPKQAQVIRPPYARKPSDAQKTLWTDHYLVVAVLP